MEYLKTVLFSPTLNFIGLIVLVITYKIKKDAKNNRGKR